MWEIEFYSKIHKKISIVTFKDASDLAKFLETNIWFYHSKKRLITIRYISKKNIAERKAKQKRQGRVASTPQEFFDRSYSDGSDNERYSG